MITLNRPENMNALSSELLEELNLTFDRIAVDAEISGVIKLETQTDRRSFRRPF